MRIFFSLTLLSLFLYSETINEQIHALEDATPKERVSLMNSIKEQLVSMNEDKRMQTIETLREKIEHTSDVEHKMIEVDNHEEVVEHVESSHIQDELHQHEQHHEESHPEENHEETNHNDRIK